jgi:hypothetical protein
VIIMRIVFGVLLFLAAVLGGCAGLHPTAYNGKESCNGVGGIYTSDGRCIAGNT